MVDLAARVLPVFTNPANTRWGAADVFGSDLYRALEVLEQEAETGDPVEAYAVTVDALTAMRRVAAQARHDPEEVMEDIFSALLGLHPKLAERAGVPAGELVDWMMRFQFAAAESVVLLDPVDYAPALGELGIAVYRQRLQEHRAALTQANDESEDVQFILNWQAQRLAVLDRDVDAVIETHLGDRTCADQFFGTALALEEIGEPDLAILWAQRGAYFDLSADARDAGTLWCLMMAGHTPEEVLDGRLAMLRRWPDWDSALALFEVAGPAWPQYQDEVIKRLSADPGEAAQFALEVLGDVQLAWDLAHDLGLQDLSLWADLAAAYMAVDEVAVLPVFEWLVYAVLRESQVKAYRVAAQLLTTMREIAAGTEHQAYVEDLIARLPGEFPRRSLMVQAFREEGLNGPLRPRVIAEPAPVVEPVEPAVVQLTLD